MNPKRKSLPTFLHDEEGNQVWIAPLLAADIQKARKTGKHPMNQKRLFLHTVASAPYRQQVYHKTAAAWQDLEQALLPTYGGRGWTVKVVIRDPVNHKGHAVSPFFTFHDGSLEVAVWPHWLLSIPEPPRFPGYSKGAAKPKANHTDEHDKQEESDEEEEEEEEMDEVTEELEEMQARQVSNLSELALAERWRVPVPVYTIKWVSPLHETFTSRKSAWEHAKKLCQQEVFLDKVLAGYTANGTPVTKIVTPGKQTVLKAGHLRFLRDGLWVVGQEEAWQRQRLAEMQAVPGAIVTPPATPRLLSPLALYIQENRKAHQTKRLAELSATMFKDEKASFTLREAETELRTIWKSLSAEERESWAEKFKPEKEADKQVSELQMVEDGTDKDEIQKVAARVDVPPKSQAVAQPKSTGKEAGEKEPAVAEESNAAPKPFVADKNQASVQSDQKPAAIPKTAGRVTPPSDTDAPPSPYVASSAVLSVDIPESRPKDVNPDGHATDQKPSPQPSKAESTQIIVVPSKPGPSSAWCLNEKQIELCYDTGLEHFDRVLATVQARDLTRELQDGFDVLRERGKGRFDMELPDFDGPEFSFITDLKKTPWMPIVRQILGKDVVLIHKGIFLSLPGSETQNYHQDGPHLTTVYQKPCHAINVFVPLVDLVKENGPTEFCLGSHILGHEDYNEDNIEIPVAKAGSPVIFDYRLGHRGLANTSDSPRPVLYCTYAAAADGKEFRDSVNFSRKRYHKIGDMVTTKTLSREERARKRQKAT